jgi:hypothetical protein
MLEDMPGFEDALAGHKELKKAQTKYNEALGKLVEKIKSWRGDDPVAAIYARVFNEKNVIELDRDDESIKRYMDEVAWRYREQVPPGYKDGGKADSGIGDYLIWKCLLVLGESQKKHLAFVTDETKADWFVRTSGQHVYPRLELVDEYRRVSGGKVLRLMSLHQLLEEHKAPTAVVRDVKTAEIAVRDYIVFYADASLRPRPMLASMVPRTPGTEAFHAARARGEEVRHVFDPTFCLLDADDVPPRISNAGAPPYLDASMGYSGPLYPQPGVRPAGKNDNK